MDADTLSLSTREDFVDQPVAVAVEPLGYEQANIADRWPRLVRLAGMVLLMVGVGRLVSGAALLGMYGLLPLLFPSIGSNPLLDLYEWLYVCSTIVFGAGLTIAAIALLVRGPWARRLLVVNEAGFAVCTITTAAIQPLMSNVGGAWNLLNMAYSASSLAQSLGIPVFVILVARSTSLRRGTGEIAN
jgi:hypothetical protein